MGTISLSVVLYQTSREDITTVIDSIRQTSLDWRLLLVDNSPSDSLRDISSLDERIIYFHGHGNHGFGYGHNIAMKKAVLLGVKYHFVVNPDIMFKADVLTPMVELIKRDPSIGMVMPKILNMDGTTQFLPKLIPNPLWILFRKIRKPSGYYKKFINKYEMRDLNEIDTVNLPLISGCFTLFNLKVIEKMGGYDENFFMYFEDFDISRRIHEKYKTLYFPKVSVYHGYAGGANKNKRLFKIFIQSAIIYFNKWGWIVDNNRRKINHEALEQLNN